MGGDQVNADKGRLPVALPVQATRIVEHGLSERLQCAPLAAGFLSLPKSRVADVIGARERLRNVFASRDPLEVRKATLAWSNGPGVFLEDIDGISCARRGKSWRGDGQSFRSG